MDLTGQLSNLSAALEKLLSLPLPAPHDAHLQRERRPNAIFRQRAYELVRDALVDELSADGPGLRLIEIRRRVEERLGSPVDGKRFKDYVNDQSKGADPLLERIGWGTYRLR